jgi:hypothetical protein
MGTKHRNLLQIYAIIIILTNPRSMVYARQSLDQENTMKVTKKQPIKVNSFQFQTITCQFENNDKASKSFRILNSINLGLDSNHQNESKQPNSLTFIKAASGVKFNEDASSIDSKSPFPNSFLIIQDSSRSLASLQLTSLKEAKNDGFQSVKVKSIKFIPLDSKKNMDKYEDSKLDYEKFRKKTKIDLESMAILPSGKILILGSGSDILNGINGKPYFRSNAILIDPQTQKKSIFNIFQFYKKLQSIPEVVGNDIGKEKAQLNIEGISIRPKGDKHIISFFHRGNVNGNNSVIEFDFESWEKFYLSFKKNAKLLEPVPLRVVRIDLGVVKNKITSKDTPITLNDALYGEQFGKPLWYIPVAAESDYVDSHGNQHDGIVTFSGIARWQDIDNPQGGKCIIFQAPGDKSPGEKSIFGKLEGLAAFSPDKKSTYERSFWTENALVVGVNDIDNEDAPSKFSFLDLKDTYE